MSIPSLIEEKLLAAQGYHLVAGIDEVGRGCIAGPVCAGAVILPARLRAAWTKEVRDSKELTPSRRELLAGHIRKAAAAFGIGVVDAATIDAQGIAHATRTAMKKAIAALSPMPQFLLIDYLQLPGVSIPQKGVVDGDSCCFSIACASIIAKVARDQLMVELAEQYPGYGFAGHKGYGTEEHIACLRRLGPSLIHRRTFSPLKEMFPLFI
ncbi:MAG: ribonuclease HII [Chloroflexi bacterium]|nr:ribonuclease HII [Chloroflexota bacterium]